MPSSRILVISAAAAILLAADPMQALRTDGTDEDLLLPPATQRWQTCPSSPPKWKSHAVPKQVYTVGVLAFRGIESAFAQFNTTFADYLTHTAGARFGPQPVRFQMKPVVFGQEVNVIDQTLSGDFDFLFVHPAMYSCVESEASVRSVATFINRRTVQGEKHDLNQFGGVIFVRSDNDDIHSVRDLKGKRVGCVSIEGLGSGQMQFREMQKAGLHHIQDLQQLIFYGSQVRVLDSVLNGQVDVGFVRTDQLERSLDPDTGEPLDLSRIRVIGDQTNVIMDNGEIFPFPISTPLYPEWNLAALRSVHPKIVRSVQTALLDMAEHASVVPALLGCMEHINCTTIECQENCLTGLDHAAATEEDEVRCDTDGPTALLAADAMTTAKTAGWVPSLSYMELRSMQEETGFISIASRLPNGQQAPVRCVRATEISEAVVCPAGYSKRPDDQIEQSCALAGLACYDFQCLCSPCVKNVSYEWLLPAIFVPLLILVVLGAIVYVQWKKHQLDAVWKVKTDELRFDEPTPLVLGRGTFGLVVLAEFRGTQVAVKRVLPPREANERQALSPFDFPKADDLLAAGSPYAKMTDLEQAVPNGDHIGNKSYYPVMKLGLWNDGWNNKIGSDSVGKLIATEPTNRHRTRMRQAFIGEMRLLSKLRHPSIVAVMGAVVNRKAEPQLVMEYMALGSLHGLLHNDTMILDGETLLPMLQDITQGLRFLHSHDIVHGDIKSANVLVDGRFRAKIADFGLTQKKSYYKHCIPAVGTPFWMAPELLRGETSNTTESDVYALGIVLNEIFSRKDPYCDDESNDHAQILRHVADPRVNKRPPVPEKCPEAAADVITSCLRAEPDQRPTMVDIDIRVKLLDAQMAQLNEMWCTVSDAKLRNRKGDLLSQMFPKHIADALRKGHKVEPENHECISVLFCEIEGFSEISSELSAEKTSDLLDRFYSRLDSLCDNYDVFKVETVGQAYLAVTNIAKPQETTHARLIAQFAIDAVEEASETLIDTEDPTRGHLQVRIGISSGPVVSHVMGKSNPRFSVIGETVNMAARMEESGKPGRIHCSQATAEILQEQDPGLKLKFRGRKVVKGKRAVAMSTYWVAYTGMSAADDCASRDSSDSASGLARSRRNVKVRRPKSAVQRLAMCDGSSVEGTLSTTSDEDETCGDHHSSFSNQSDGGRRGQRQENLAGLYTHLRTEAAGEIDKKANEARTAKGAASSVSMVAYDV